MLMRCNISETCAVPSLSPPAPETPSGVCHSAMTRQESRRLSNCLSILFVSLLALPSPASASWKEKVLYSFQGYPDGATPAGGLVFDKAANLYGATQRGGSDNNGEVFELSPPAQKGGAWTETVLYSFLGNLKNDGQWPNGGLVIDGSGNLYGVTAYGGTGDCKLAGILIGCGVVYEISPPAHKGGAWTESIVYSFPSSKEGYLPNGNLIFDSAGNLYGATMFGGGYGTTCDPYYQYCGAVFRLSPPKRKGGKWTGQALYGFKGGTDGANPNGGLVLDRKGAVYGTTYSGGNRNCNYQDETGCGTVFKLSPQAKKGTAWQEKQLHVFTGGDDGGQPNGGLILDAKGSLYGTAGGGNPSGGGIAFQLAASNGRWKETVLHWFSNNGPGAFAAGLIFDSSGNLYGPTDEGAQFRGTVVRLKRPSRQGGKWVAAVLYTFQGSPDGARPAANLVFDKAGNLYSTTQWGGTGQSCQGGCGTVFEVEP
jgi:uncharacterized repeat protein (TIGR03803 family)